MSGYYYFFFKRACILPLDSFKKREFKEHTNLLFSKWS